jgi:moderate conductance mechanosensitive channel
MAPMQLDPAAMTTLKIAGIAVGAVVAYAILRAGIGAAVRHLLARRPGPADEPIAAVEVQRRMQTLQLLAVRVVGSAIALVGLLMILSEVGIDVGPAVAGLGVIGIAVGFGAQTLIRDWLAGIFVILENQYSAGDVVRIAGVEGVVEDFSLRRTVIRDADGTVHTVPNGQIIVASNLSRGSRVEALHSGGDEVTDPPDGGESGAV